MANIVELRGMSGDKLREMVENAREEMFNLRFQKASARLEDYTRIKVVRREIAQLETVLRMRQLAKEAAVAQPEIAGMIADKEWQATARFNYEDSAWNVEFADQDGKQLATASVNLNKTRTKGRRARRAKGQPNVVVSYEIAE